MSSSSFICVWPQPLCGRNVLKHYRRILKWQCLGTRASSHIFVILSTGFAIQSAWSEDMYRCDDCHWSLCLCLHLSFTWFWLLWVQQVVFFCTKHLIMYRLRDARKPNETLYLMPCKMDKHCDFVRAFGRKPNGSITQISHWSDTEVGSTAPSLQIWHAKLVPGGRWFCWSCMVKLPTLQELVPHLTCRGYCHSGGLTREASHALMQDDTSNACVQKHNMLHVWHRCNRSTSHKERLQH